MTRIDALLAAGRTRSLEFFPPRTEVGHRNLAATLGAFDQIDPAFVSVTYGAGGSTRDLTRDLVIEIGRTHHIPAMPHLTCVGHSKGELVALLEDYAAHGVDNVLALAGDPPADGSDPGGDFRYAAELVELIREVGDFSVGVAAFPEGHPRSTSLADDRRFLAEKLRLADFGITQFFFRSEDYFRMVDDLSVLGVDRPIVPGVIPMLDTGGVRRFADLNGAWFPDDLASRVDRANEADRLALAVDAAVTLCEELVRGGAPGVHLYCMNRAEAPREIFASISL